MDMKNVIKMEITRKGDALSSIKVFMPTWQKKGIDGKIYISLPVFGVETYAMDEIDAETAIKEAVACFCIMAESHGKGLENELELLGWSRDDINGNVLDITPDNFAFGSMIDTGEQRALEFVEFESYLQAA